jgi:hypothetical protein
MTWRKHAALLVLAALPAASAAAAPTPEELWKEFPLEPPPATTPAQAPAAPAPVEPFTPPPVPLEQAPEEEFDWMGTLLWLAGGALGILVGLGILVVAAALRRREWRPRQRLN